MKNKVCPIQVNDPSTEKYNNKVFGEYTIQIPYDFCNSISLDEVKFFPVIAGDGLSYSLENILEWFKKGNKKSPSTGLPINTTTLIFDNRLYREMVHFFKVLLTKDEAQLKKTQNEPALKYIQQYATNWLATTKRSGLSKLIYQALQLNVSVEGLTTLLSKKEIDNFSPANDVFQQAQTCINKKSLKKAIPLLSQAITLDPYYAEFYSHRGSYNLNNPDEAIKDFNKAIELDSERSKTYCLRAAFLHDVGRHMEAKADCEKALALLPDYRSDEINPHAGAYWVQGKCLVAEERYDEALESYNASIKIYPDARVYAYRGEVWWQKKEYKKAISDYKQAIQLNKDYDGAYSGLGLVLCDCKKYKEAIKNHFQAIQLNPVAYYYCRLGFTFLESQDFSNAVKYYNISIQKDPRRAVSYGNLGFALEAQGQDKEAIKNYQKAWALLSENKDFNHASYAGIKLEIALKLYRTKELDEATIILSIEQLKKRVSSCKNPQDLAVLELAFHHVKQYYPQRNLQQLFQQFSMSDFHFSTQKELSMLNTMNNHLFSLFKPALSDKDNQKEHHKKSWYQRLCVCGL